MSTSSTGATGRAAGKDAVLGLLVTDATPELRALLVAMRHRCRPLYAGPGGVSEAAAYIVRGPAPDLPAGAAIALWLPDGAEPDGRHVDIARVLLTAEVATAMIWRAAHAVEVIPPSRVNAQPVAPFVRRRLRAARHLDPAGVAAFEDGRWSWGSPAQPVEDDLADTLCASAASVVATTPQTAARALAWGAPLVTDSVTASVLGVLDGVHCIVESGRVGRARAARELATDERLAARLGWRGRHHFERWHDLDRVADRVADHLGLPPDRGRTRVDAVLDTLGTPAHAHIRDRASRATATLTEARKGTPQP